MMSVEKKLAYGVSAIIIAVVIGGIVSVGSPGDRRMERLDNERVNDLYTIANWVGNEYGKAGAIPTTLEGVNEEAYDSYYVSSLTDPVTEEPYAYEPVTESSFNLCATFDRSTLDAGKDDAATEARRLMPVMKTGGIDFSRHPAGRHCFEVDARLLAPFASCSLRNPCQEGSTCAVLPGETTAVCIPVGFECKAAGCDGDLCAMTKSYPAQVRCLGDDAPPAPPALDDDASSCVLMQDRATGEVDCFGCAGTVCKDPTPSHVPYQSDGIGIPYSCYVAETGCELAQ